MTSFVTQCNSTDAVLSTQCWNSGARTSSVRSPLQSGSSCFDWYVATCLWSSLKTALAHTPLHLLALREQCRGCDDVGQASRITRAHTLLLLLGVREECRDCDDVGRCHPHYKYTHCSLRISTARHQYWKSHDVVASILLIHCRQVLCRWRHRRRNNRMYS